MRKFNTDLNIDVVQDTADEFRDALIRASAGESDNIDETVTLDTVLARKVLSTLDMLLYDPEQPVEL